jgi:hypothetical protein
MTGDTLESRRERARLLLRDDPEFYVDSGAVKIVNKRGELVTMKLKRPQRRLLRALKRQRAAGEPQRAIALKARQIGISTVTQVVNVGRATQTANHLALTVGQDRDTTSALFDIGIRSWQHQPAEIKPPTAYQGGTKERRYARWGEPSLRLRRAGIVGLDSIYETATPKTAAAGRGRTIHSLHLSEIAFWPDYTMMLGIAQGVPDTPESLVIKESTANGENEFKDEWDLAVAGRGGYYAFFSPWFEEEDYRRPFANEIELQTFAAMLGEDGDDARGVGTDELDLLELIERSYREWAVEDGEPAPDEEVLRRSALERLHWRRWTVANKTQGSILKFKQEYPSTPDEAFLTTGQRVFDAELVDRVRKLCRKSDPAVPTAETPGPARGALEPVGMKEVRARRHITVQKPEGARWVPAREIRGGSELVPRWRHWGAPTQGRWEHNEEGAAVWIPSGQYIVSCDPASGEEDDKGTVHANHGVTVIDHRTRRQVAEYESQIDPDLLALEIYMAALYWNRAWVVVERTGGYGLSILRRLALDFKYPRVFEDESRDKRMEDRFDRLGFSTDSVSKPLLEARTMELLREGTHGIQSRRLAGQLGGLVRDKRGRTAPGPGKLSDVLMSWQIGQHVATLRPLRPEKPGGGRTGPTRGARPKASAPRGMRTPRR